jgi:hypothetical protein
MKKTKWTFRNYKKYLETIIDVAIGVFYQRVKTNTSEIPSICILGCAKI